MDDVYSTNIVLQTYQKHTPEFRDLLETRVFVHDWQMNDDLRQFIQSNDFRRHHVVVSEDLIPYVNGLVNGIRSKARPTLKSQEIIVKIHCIKTFIFPA